MLQEQVKAEGQATESEWKSPGNLSPETEWTPQTILSAEVTGTIGNRTDRTVLHFEQPFPFFDGNDITLMREYGCYVGVPLSVSLQLMAEGAVEQDGIFITETSGLDADRYFEEMEARGFTLVEEQLPEPASPAPNRIDHAESTASALWTMPRRDPISVPRGSEFDNCRR